MALNKRDQITPGEPDQAKGQTVPRLEIGKTDFQVDVPVLGESHNVEYHTHRILVYAPRQVVGNLRINIDTPVLEVLVDTTPRSAEEKGMKVEYVTDPVVRCHMLAAEEKSKEGTYSLEHLALHMPRVLTYVRNFRIIETVKSEGDTR